MSSETLVSIRNLEKSYKTIGGPLWVLRGLDLEIQRGEMIAVMGLSGVGKSTLLNIVGLLDTQTDGDLLFHVEGREIATRELSLRKRARLRNNFLGFVFQSFHLLPDLTVLENVLLPSMISRSPGSYRAEKGRLEARAHDLIARVGVSERESHRPTALSGGERQRVALARGLMNEPSLLLCDEPTGNLDIHTSIRIHDLLRELNRTLKTTVLVVTHDADLASHAHRTLNMEDGRFTDPEIDAS